MNLTPTQRNKIYLQFPELRNWLEEQARHEEIKDLMRKNNTLPPEIIAKIKAIKGDKGDKGEDGYTPVKGKDYYTNTELTHIISFILKEATPIKGEHYKDGEDYVLTESDIKKIARSVEVPVMERVIEKTETIKEVIPKLDVSMVKGAISKKELDAEHKKILDGMSLVDGRIKAIDQRWHGGGLSRVNTDSTLTGSGTSSSPLSVVSSGTFIGSQEKSTTTPNGSQTTFAFTHTPRAIFWNGSFQTLTDDYTVSSNNITFTASAGVPQTVDKITNLYA